MMMFKLGRKNKPTTAVTEDQPQLAVVSWTKGQWLTGMAARVLIWILVLCGALALAGVAYLMTRPAPEAPAATVDPEPDGREAAAELAQRAVKLMLTTTRGDENQVAEVLPRIQLPREAADVTNITTAETTHERGTWVVTVAADVDSIRRYYQVPIAVTDDGMTVLMLPSQVAAPRIAPRPESPYRVQVPSNDPAALAAGSSWVPSWRGQVMWPATPPRAARSKPSRRPRTNRSSLSSLKPWRSCPKPRLRVTRLSCTCAPEAPQPMVRQAGLTTS